MSEKNNLDSKDTENGAIVETTKLENLLTKLDENVAVIIIEKDEHFGKATELLKKIKTSIKECESSRKKFISPFNDFVSTINLKFKPIKIKAENIKANLESKILIYHKTIEEKRRKEAEKIRQEEIKQLEKERAETEKKEAAAKEEQQRIVDAASSFLDEETEIVKPDNDDSEKIQAEIEEKKASPLEVQTNFKTENVTTSIRKIWTYEILDTSEIPKEFCTPDPKKISLAIKTGAREIPGIRIFEKESVVSR